MQSVFLENLTKYHKQYRATSLIECLVSFFNFWNTLILSDFKKVNGIFEWGNFFTTQGVWL